ncbi:MAG: twin-arginine translocation signal domain-containing protein [Gemmatimonadota bacterium]|nr:twin-arginine translocation signal domain-containing protein [Gemmatimonadota bacterium]MDE3172919.1 twin-arginine translocation signal domain-containing protein [Gemmatimonadota bacterium]
MSPSRRTFVKLSAALGGALGLGAVPDFPFGDRGPHAAGAPRRPAGRAATPLDLLIIGGTGFTGPAQVNYALERGHKVTLFNRNKTRPDLFKGAVTELIGDLNDDTSALEGKRFDVVIDNPTTSPIWVRNVARYMAGHTGHYIFISTMSVYADNSRPDMDETDGLTPMPAGVDPFAVPAAQARNYYGAFKTYCEGLVEKTYPGINTIIRPGLIVGPLDASDRFTYWPYRIDQGGEVLAPNSPDDPTQFIDARDLAEWTIRMAEQHEMGIYNAVGPAQPMNMAELLYGIRAVTTAGARFTWVPTEFLTAHGVHGWRHMPVWVPPTGATAGFLRRGNARAVGKGLRFRPLAETARDTLDWNRTRPQKALDALAQGAVAGIPAAKEAEVLAAWHAAQGAR